MGEIHAHIIHKHLGKEEEKGERNREEGQGKGK